MNQNSVILSQIGNIYNSRVSLPKKICDAVGLRNKDFVSIVNIIGNKSFDVNKYDPNIQYNEQFGFIREVKNSHFTNPPESILADLDANQERTTLCQLLDNGTIRVSLC